MSNEPIGFSSLRLNRPKRLQPSTLYKIHEMNSILKNQIKEAIQHLYELGFTDQMAPIVILKQELTKGDK